MEIPRTCNFCGKLSHYEGYNYDSDSGSAEWSCKHNPKKEVSGGDGIEEHREFQEYGLKCPEWVNAVEWEKKAGERFNVALQEHLNQHYIIITQKPPGKP